MTIDNITPECLRRFPLLDALGNAELAALVEAMELRQVRSGAFVVTYGADSSEAYLVLDGRLKVCRSDGRGKETIMSLLNAGDWFGEVALLAERKRSADVVAQADCTLAVLTRPMFMQHSVKHPGLSLAFLRVLSERLYSASDQIATLALFDVRERLVRTLGSIGRPHPEAPASVTVVRPRPTHQDLARMIGASREAVTRHLGDMEADGQILVEDDTLYLRRSSAAS
jgi:CRP/FNR family cyclic AMP-dependent transcriptional regulator